MPILGVESVTYGVKDIEPCARFYEDFGLAVAQRDEKGVDFALEEGSSIKLRRDDDPALPEPSSGECSVREVVWGVDSAGTLDRIERNLRSDRKVARDAAGTLHTRDDQNIAIGFRVFQRRPVTVVLERHNELNQAERINRHRTWFDRARPKLIHHVVFGVPDAAKASRFYIERLNFRLSDVSKKLGIFLRCDGRNDHHNLFFLKSEFLKSNSVTWHHASFGVQNVDELMAGANYMQRKGWASDLGIGRHRIASTLFYYMKNPAGGESEYSADNDFLTDEWKPRLWDANFGAFSWIGKLPPFALEGGGPHRDVRVIDEPNPDLAQLLDAASTDYRGMGVPEPNARQAAGR